VSESNIVEEFEELLTINPTSSPGARNARLSKTLGFLADLSLTKLFVRIQSLFCTSPSESVSTLSLTISLALQTVNFRSSYAERLRERAAPAARARRRL
jgi:hypothetical protein